MDRVLAAFQLKGHGFSPEALLFFTGLIAVWGVARPTFVRDADGRRLPPNLTARFVIVLVYVLGYLGLVAAFVFGKTYVMNVVSAGPEAIQNAFKSFEQQSPLLAAMALGALQSLTPYREAERAFIIWVHSMRHLHGDVSTLMAHFQTCAFTPSDVEHQKNLDDLARHNIFLTDSKSRGIDLPSVQTWRKLTTMLRCLREWNKNERRILSDVQMGLLEELERAHARKTRLAAEILRLLNLVSTGKGATEILGQLSTLLAQASHSNREAVADVEAQLKGLLGAGEHPERAPVHLSSAELRAFLAQIDGYFQVEYQILLRQVGELAAISIVYAGDLAPERLREIKRLGFQGLGRIEPVNFDRILWLFLTISIGGFSIFYLLRYNQLKAMPEANARGLLTSFAVFSLTMALAALIGAAYGSNKKYAHAQHTPWGAYFTAGILSVGMFVTAHAVRLLLTPLEDQGSNPGQVLPLYRQVPWAIIPLLLTVGICRLARMSRWPVPTAWVPTATAGAVWQRSLDGITLGILMFVAYSGGLMIHEVFNIPLPSALRDAPYTPMVYIPTVLFGFLIGCVAVRDTRRAGQATIIDHSSNGYAIAEEPSASSNWRAGAPLSEQPAE